MHDHAVVALRGGMAATVCSADAEAVNRYRWYPIVTRGKTYAYGRIGRRSGIYLHRLVLSAPAGQVVDHIDGDGLNNCRRNLRLGTTSQNQANSGPRGGSSEFKGVHFRRDRGVWQAQIEVDRHRRSLGNYASEDDAARAYDFAAFQTWGEFAWRNFPDEVPFDVSARRLRRPWQTVVAAQ